ncbi:MULTISPECIES: ATP-grasp domain-containing protein [Thermomonosporaceae]|uniref:ATP-grasp domain-containing protein n=1 Tax=Thermomonosporaceae TaxID=2012 RepID=UPI00255B0905|nr:MULTISPECIES: ATP-grasp domain-containing protein [Thermomonosporaceae]MDL4773900.1 ATP-grasp domain-containing protein [Actinomadura xylanilytica]
MDRPVVAIVQPFTSAAMIAPALRAAGLSPVAVLDYAVPAWAPLHAAHEPGNFDAIINHHGDLAETTGRLRALNPIAVIPGLESALHLAQELSDALTPASSNVPGLVDARRHKYLMHQAVAAAGLPVPRQICTRDADEAAGWIEREGLTGANLVIKPPASAATVGVSLAPGGRGWREQFEALLGTRDKLDEVTDEVLVMEHLTGTEYAVDTVSHDGRHSVTDIIKYKRIPFGEGIAVYDSVEWLPYDRDRYGDLIDYGLGALDAVGLRNWAAHTEIMMTSDGPRLVEVNARLAGAGNPAVTEIATGGSQVTRIVDVCRGLGAEMPPGYTLRRNVMAVFLMSHSTGTVRNAEIYDLARELPSYHSPVHVVRTGDHVDASTDLLASMTMGYIILAHESSDQIHADREAVRKIEKDLIVTPDA